MYLFFDPDRRWLTSIEWEDEFQGGVGWGEADDLYVFQAGLAACG